MRSLRRLIPTVSTLCCLLSAAFEAPAQDAPSDAANRLTYLDQADPYYVGLGFPRLTTPQWVGEPGVDAVVILAIDDLRNNVERYEAYLRPILERLKQIDGRAPVSIMTNQVDPENPQLQAWLREGLSIEAHTLDHPCPLLQDGDFEAAERTYHGGVDLISEIEGNRPVAFRMPCCDSINSPSPRFYQQIFNERSEEARFLTIDSSICVELTPEDDSLPERLVTDENGAPRFLKYTQFNSYVNTIQNYPYPYLIERLCWQFPCVAPSDWQAQNLHGANNPRTVEDWKRALDAIVLKRGVFTMVFHPHGWIGSDQVVEFIDDAVEAYGPRVKFLTFREAQARIDREMLGNQPVRDEFGRDNGVRLIDLDDDGYLDVLLADGGPRLTKLWRPAGRRWEISPMPTSVIGVEGAERPERVRFGILDPGGPPVMIGGIGPVQHAWVFEGGRWVRDDSRIQGLPTDIDGLRLRDLDGDGRCEAILGGRDQAARFGANGVYAWSPERRSWRKLDFNLPGGAWTSGTLGLDAGLRFLDLDGDGVSNDLVFSNEERYGAYLFTSMDEGWSKRLRAGSPGDADAIPPIVREFGLSNGFFVKDEALWWINEDTSDREGLAERLPFSELLEGAEAGEP